MPQNKTDYNIRNNPVQDQYTPAENAGQQKSSIMRKRIGSTTYLVNVHFSDTGTETANDKILRIIRNEVSEKAVG